MTDKPIKTRPKKMALKNISLAKIDVQHGHFVGYLIGPEHGEFYDSEDDDEDDEELDSNDRDEEKKDVVAELGITSKIGPGQSKGPPLPFGQKGVTSNLQNFPLVKKAGGDGRRNSVAMSQSGVSNSSKRTSRSKYGGSRYGGGTESKELQPYLSMVNRVQAILKEVDKSLSKKTERISNPTKNYMKENENKEDEDKVNSDNDSVPDTSEDYMGRIIIEYLQSLGKCSSAIT